MNVKQLLEVLSKLEDPENIDVYFSYDSRVCCPYVNVVDLVDNGAACDRRVTASMFMEGYQKPEVRKSIVLRSEDKWEYEFQSPSLNEGEYRAKITKEAWDKNIEWSRLWYYKKYGNPYTGKPATEEELKTLIAKDIEDDIKIYRRHKAESDGNVNLFFEGDE